MIHSKLLSLTLCLVLTAADPPQGQFDESWMAILLNGQKLGYMHSEMTRRDDVIRSRTRTHMQLQRAGLPLSISMTMDHTETVNGNPLGFRSEELFSEFPVYKTGTIRDGTIHLVTEQFGQRLEQQIPYPTGSLMPWGLYLEQMRHPAEPGTKFSVRAFVPAQALNVGIPTTVEVVGREDINLLGRTVPAIKTRTEVEINGVTIETQGWTDGEWRPLKQKMALMGLEFEMVACDRRYALQDLASPELFVNTLIPIGRALDRDGLRRVTYEITAIGDAKLPQLPETSMQKIVFRGADRLRVAVTRVNHESLRGASAVPPPADLAEYLQPSVFITSNDPQVMKMAAQAAGEHRDPYDVAQALCRKVAQEISYKDLGTAFASAAEVCRRKTGDCTEHGVLLAALARARGIPSRVVTGLMYVPAAAGVQDVMGFHMWTQLWISGRWIDFDAAWGQVDVDPTHLALGTHSTRDGTMGSLVSSVMLKMSDFKISILEAKTGS